MYKKIEIYEGDCFNPYRNLAVESALYEVAEEGVLKVFLWQNDNTVVIGRNQNAYLDVNLENLSKSGGLLARRPTGGGAVYHDKGNLNFSFVTGRKNYDVQENNDIILQAVKQLGFSAEVTGRNDMVIDGRKFSGHAYLKNNIAALHHGTLLIKTDTDIMTLALNVSQDKLSGKGVSSVKARVVNLTELDDKITVSDVKTAIVSVLKNKYDDVVIKSLADVDADTVEKYRAKYSDKNYILGDGVKLESKRYKRFVWGYADVHFTLSGGVIRAIKIYSDGLNTDEIEEAEKALSGVNIEECFISENTTAQDIFSLLK